MIICKDSLIWCCWLQFWYLHWFFYLMELIFGKCLYTNSLISFPSPVIGEGDFFSAIKWLISSKGLMWKLHLLFIDIDELSKNISYIIFWKSHRGGVLLAEEGWMKLECMGALYCFLSSLPVMFSIWFAFFFFPFFGGVRKEKIHYRSKPTKQTNKTNQKLKPTTNHHHTKQQTKA